MLSNGRLTVDPISVCNLSKVNKPSCITSSSTDLIIRFTTYGCKWVKTMSIVHFKSLAHIWVTRIGILFKHFYLNSFDSSVNVPNIGTSST